MSMRMCSLASRVHGEHSRNTTLNSTHCSSSQEFDEVSKILRTVALARRDQHGGQDQPGHAFANPGVDRVDSAAIGSNALSNASRAPTSISPRPAAGAAGRSFYFCLGPHGLALRPSPLTLIRAATRRQWPKLVAVTGGGTVQGRCRSGVASPRSRAPKPWLTNSKPSVNQLAATKVRGGLRGQAAAPVSTAGGDARVGRRERACSGSRSPSGLLRPCCCRWSPCCRCHSVTAALMPFVVRPTPLTRRSCRAGRRRAGGADRAA